MGAKTPFEIEPGIVKVDAPYALRNRWIDCDKVRFMRGRPEKHKGYELFAGPLTGTVRAIKAWDDFSGSRHVVGGTTSKLQHIDSDAVVTNITPLEASGQVTDPFTFVNGSTTVTVNINSHGTSVGDTVNFSNANTVAGVFVNGDYQVTSVVNGNSFTIEASPAANADTSGGGLVDYEIEIAVGSNNSTQGSGYGVGPYGFGFYGVPRSVSSYTTYARTWSLDLYGEYLLAMPSGNRLYQWNPNNPADRAELVTNSPTGEFMFVTNERYPVVLGAGGALMDIAWPHQTDITDWTASATSTANRRTLKEGSRLVGGGILLGTLSLVWSDTACYLMQYTGAKNIIYTTVPASRQCGLIGPNAFVMVGGRAYWMSAFSFFMYAGGVTHIPRSDEIESWIYDRLSSFQNWKCFAHYSSENNEVTWFYVEETETEPKHYVALSLDDYSWSVGTYDRTAMEEQAGINPRTYGADNDGYIYYHNVGVDAAGQALAAHIESAPVDVEDGNAIADVFGYVPNFERQSGVVNLTVYGWDYPQDASIQETAEEEIAENQGMVDLHFGARQVSMKLSTNVIGGDFRLGAHRFEVQGSGRRR